MLMEPVNITARGFDNISQLRNKYETELLSYITESEKEALTTKVVKHMNKLYNNRNDKYSNISNNKKNWLDTIISKCKIAKGSKWLEMGMSHTHADVIIFSQDMFNDKSFSWATFIHECVHIDQRLNLDRYESLYKLWGFIDTNVSAIKGMESIMIRNRLNPDAIDFNWIWKCHSDDNYYWIGAVFNSITPSSLGDVSYVGLKLEHRGYDNNTHNFYYNGTDTRNLNNWREFKEYFDITNNQYHPNEIIAEYMGIYFSNEDKNAINKNTEKQKYKGYNIFVKWFNNIEN
jgi:hypothetical protein